MISDKKKRRIESLSTDEMLYEINLGNKSRFQREKFAYLQTCYQKRIEQIKLIEKLNSTNLEDVEQNLHSFRYPNNEVPIIRNWIQEQKLKGSDQNQTRNKPLTNANRTEHPMEGTLKKIAVGVIIGVLTVMIIWVLNHYLNLGL